MRREQQRGVVRQCRTGLRRLGIASPSPGQANQRVSNRVDLAAKLVLVRTTDKDCLRPEKLPFVERENHEA